LNIGVCKISLKNCQHSKTRLLNKKYVTHRYIDSLIS
jgi:hypothetical protein